MQVTPELPWFKERVLANVSLCDVAVIVLLRVVAVNLKVIRVRQHIRNDWRDSTCLVAADFLICLPQCRQVPAQTCHNPC